MPNFSTGTLPSAAAITKVATGAYDVGFGDMNALIDLVSKKPEDAPADEEEEEPAAVAQWNRLIAAQMKAGLPRQRAASKVAKSHPQLRAQMIAEANQSRGVKA
jgi:hypothetical protein